MKRMKEKSQEGRKLPKPGCYLGYFKHCSLQFQYCLSTLNGSNSSGKLFKQQFNLWAVS